MNATMIGTKPIPPGLVYIDTCHYRISDKLAGKISRDNPATNGNKGLPLDGYEREVSYGGYKWYLTRTNYRYRIDSPARGWVWCLYSPH